MCKFLIKKTQAGAFCSAMGRETISKSRVSPKNERSRNNLKAICIFVAMLVCCNAHSQLFAQKKTVYVIPETAKVYYNGHEVGNGSYEVKFGKNEDFVMLKFVAPGYITRTVKLFKNNPKKTVSYELFVDDAEQNSVGAGEGLDLANKSFTVVCKKGMTEDVVWKRLMNIAVTNFGECSIKDR